ARTADGDREPHRRLRRLCARRRLGGGAGRRAEDGKASRLRELPSLGRGEAYPARQRHLCRGGGEVRLHMNVKDLFDLSGKTALLTGGSRGLGLQIAEALAELRAKVAITAPKQGQPDEAAATPSGQGID